VTTTNGDTTNIPDETAAIGPTVSITLSTTPGPTLNARDRNRLHALIDHTGHCMKPWPSGTIVATMSRLRRLAAQSEYQPATLGLRLAVGPDRANATRLQVLPYDGMVLASETSQFHPRKPERRARVRSPTEVVRLVARNPGPVDEITNGMLLLVAHPMPQRRERQKHSRRLAPPARDTLRQADQAFRPTHTETDPPSRGYRDHDFEDPSWWRDSGLSRRKPPSATRFVRGGPLSPGGRGCRQLNAIPHALAGHLDAGHSGSDRWRLR